MRELERDLPATATQRAPAAPRRLAIVGHGRAGGAIARAAAGAGITVSSVKRGMPIDSAGEVDAALICVPDAAIEEVGAGIARSDARPALVGHISGATGLDALDPAREADAETFVMHPLQTLPDSRSELSGAHCAVAGSSPAALRQASALAESLEMEPIEIADEARAAYHAAACIASNFLITLEESAAALLGAAGVEDPRAALAPLVTRTAANWAERGAEALTGPIARGDEATVERHLQALRAHAPELIATYEALAERTRELATGGDARSPEGKR